MSQKPNLAITVKEAIFEEDVDLQENKGKMDPYAKLIIADQIYETKVAINQSANPKWNETFNFVYQNNSVLEVFTYDKDSKAKEPQLLGSNTQKLKQIEKATDWIVELDLKLKGKFTGTITLEFDFIGKKPQEVQEQIYEPVDPIQKPDINFNSFDQESQVQDMEQRKEMIEKRDEFKGGIFTQYELQQAIQEGLDMLRQEKPEDQVQALGEFLVNYGKS